MNYLDAEIEQPSSGLWLSPGKRVGHLIAILSVESKDTEYDNLSKREVVVARFRFVDLDAEQQAVDGIDNHAGITNKLKVGNPKVILGRITQLPPKQIGFDPTLILGECDEGDVARFREWAARDAVAQPGASTGPVTPRPPAGPASAPPAPDAGNNQPLTMPVITSNSNDIDLSKLDATTLALIKQQLANK